MLILCRTKKILDDNPELQKQWTSLIPVGKMGRPEDLMGAVTFLSSDASSYVTVRSLPTSYHTAADHSRVPTYVLTEPTLALRGTEDFPSIPRIFPSMMELHRENKFL